MKTEEIYILKTAIGDLAKGETISPAEIEQMQVSLIALETALAVKDWSLRLMLDMFPARGEAGPQMHAETEARVIARSALTGAPSGAFVTLEQLREIEWGDKHKFHGHDHNYCPACNGLEQDGHWEDCWLAAKLKEVGDGS